MRIRLAEATDFAGIITCEHLAFEMVTRRKGNIDLQHNGALASQIRGGEVHLAVVEQQIVGYIVFTPSSDHIYVDTVAVLPDKQRRGLGSQLLAHAEQAARTQGLGSVKLFTDGRIASNVAFYERRGYSETGRCEDDRFSRVFYSKTISTRHASDPTDPSDDDGGRRQHAGLHAD